MLYNMIMKRLAMIAAVIMIVLSSCVVTPQNLAVPGWAEGVWAGSNGEECEITHDNLILESRYGDIDIKVWLDFGECRIRRNSFDDGEWHIRLFVAEGPYGREGEIIVYNEGSSGLKVAVNHIRSYDATVMHFTRTGNT